MRLPQKTSLRSIDQNDADVRAIAFTIEHDRTLDSEVGGFFHTYTGLESMNLFAGSPGTP
jgi:hypothetical protein